MSTIYRYTVNPQSPTVRMARSAQILSVAYWKGEISIWAMVNRYVGEVDRRIIVHGTGHDCEAAVEHGAATFIGTVFMEELGLVFHVFDDGEMLEGD